MPSQSSAQHRLMEAVAHNPKFAKHVGIPVSVGKDFAAADQGKKFAAGGEVVKGAIGLLRKLASKAEPAAAGATEAAEAAGRTAPILPSPIAQTGSSLPAVLGPDAGASFNDLAGKVLDAPVTRRAVLMRAATTAARGLLPDLGALGAVGEASLAPRMVSPLNTLAKAAAPAVGSFESTVLPGLVQTARALAKHPRIKPLLEGETGMKGMVNMIDSIDPTDPYVAGTMRHLMTQHIDPAAMAHYDVTPQKLHGLLADLNQVSYMRDPDMAYDLAKHADLNDALRTEVGSGRSNVEGLIGHWFPSVKRIQDLPAADKSLGMMMGRRKPMTGIMNDAYGMTNDWMGDKGTGLYDQVSYMSDKDIQNELATRRNSIFQGYPNRNQSLVERAQLRDNIDRYRSFKSAAEDLTGDAPDPDPGYADGGPVGEGSRARAQANAPPFSSIFGGLADMLSGAARGAAKTTLGWPGDLERLLGEQLPEVAGSYRHGAPLAWNLRSAAEAMDRTKSSPTVLPTSEDVGRWLPEATRFTPGPNPYETLGANAMLTPSQAGRLAVKGVKAGAGALGSLSSLAGEALTPVPRRLSQLGAVRVKGGNFDAPQLESYLRDFHTWEPVPNAQLMSLAGVTPGELGPPREAMINQWLDKQMKNYISKDLGSPTDPLLQVEKEHPSLHLPEETMLENESNLNQMLRDAAWGRQGRPGSYKKAYDKLVTHSALHGADPMADLQLTGPNPNLLNSVKAPLTPWGYNADQALRASSPEQYKFELGQREEPVPSWLDKAPPATKIWGLDQGITANEIWAAGQDPLGIGHIRDYLDAATQAHELTADEGTNALNRMVPPIQREPRMNRALALHQAGLTMDPQSLGRLSVADAVRKTARWNEHLATSGVAGDPDLARGIKQVVKEYPDSGHQWVELGEKTPTSELPPGYEMVEHPNWQERNIHRYGVKHTESGATTGAEGDTPENVIGQAWAMRNRDDLAAGLNAEGNAMGHCVGGYCEDVASRGTKIFSLRDAAGAPHVTVEVAPRDPMRWAQSLPSEQYQALRTEFGESGAPQYDHPGNPVSSKAWKDFVTAKMSADMVGDIVQVKGKQNAAPIDKYLPMVQDFVKNHGPWGRVGDLMNTGLYETSGTNAGPWESMFSSRPEMSRNQRQLIWSGYTRSNPDVRFATQQDVLGWADKNPGMYGNVDAPASDPGYARGGSVNPRFAQHFNGVR